MPRGALHSEYGPDRRKGIALLVVMVAFVVLYLVVYQLHFSTTMEERIAQVRYGEVESSTALRSAALYVLTLLIEDLRAGMEQSSQGAAMAGGALAGATNPGAGGAPVGGRGAAGGRGNFTPLTTTPSGGGSSAKTYDYIHENIFCENVQQVGDVSVKLTLIDGERAFNLNRLFDYVRLEEDEVMEGMEDLREEDLEALAGRSEEEVGETLRMQLLNRRSSGSDGRGRTRASGAGEEGDVAGAAGTGAGTGEEVVPTVEEAMSMYDLEEPFEEPSPQRIEATVEMVDRAVNMMFSINENEYGRQYAFRYSSAEVAQAIVDYVLERRRDPYQSRIFLVTELLNLPEVNREIFYGPQPQLAEGDEEYLGNGFSLVRDEFGDCVARFDDMFEDPFLEDQRLEMEDLQSQFGQFADFPGMGRLQSNALTRGMTEPPVLVDEYGYEQVAQAPKLLGLQDIFTTFSSGKINLNTASVPVLYALLLSLDTADANLVALDIRDYRNRFQEETTEEGVDRVTESETPDLGQPRRAPREETDELLADEEMGLDESLYGTDAEGYDVAAYQDLETNYFTNLRQLELIDGTDGGPMDRLRQDEGVERVSVEQDSLYRQVLYDYEKVMVFGSTYFQAKLKAKTKKGTVGKAAMLTVRRDPSEKIIEVLMWKSIQK